MNKTFFKKLSAILLAAAMMVTGVLMPSNVAEARLPDRTNRTHVKGHVPHNVLKCTADPATGTAARTVWDYNFTISLMEGYTGTITIESFLLPSNIDWNNIEYFQLKILGKGPKKEEWDEEVPNIRLRKVDEEHHAAIFTLDIYDFECGLDDVYRYGIYFRIGQDQYTFTTFDLKPTTDKSKVTSSSIDNSNPYSCEIFTYPNADTQAVESSFDLNSNVTSDGNFAMYRLKNPTTGEHLYTASAAEAANVKKAGWIDETPAGGAWKAPTKSSAPIYRLYNPNKKTYNHLYSMNQTEMANLTKAGWKVEGVAYYSDTNKGVPVYREYNKKTGDHNYTTNLAEHNQLAAQGWTAEGVAWYGVK